MKKCEKLNDKIEYCDDFKAMIRKFVDLPDCAPVGEREIKIGISTGTFNRCPFCMEWIGE